MKEINNKLVAIFLALAAISVVIISFLTHPNVEESHDISILKQPSEFFTVNSCIYRTITYVSKKENNNLLKVLDSSYKKKNKITEDNVLNVFPTISGEVTFVSKKMYYEKINNNIKKYYVKGIIKSNTIHDYTKVEKEEETELFFIVVLDSKKQVFSIEPYNGKIFMDGDENE